VTGHKPTTKADRIAATCALSLCILTIAILNPMALIPIYTLIPTPQPLSQTTTIALICIAAITLIALPILSLTGRGRLALIPTLLFAAPLLTTLP